MSRWLLITLVILGFVAPVNAMSIAECDYRRPEGVCSANVTVDREKHTYRVSSSGQCIKVDVAIDGSIFEHLMPNGGVRIDQITVFDKTRPYNVSVTQCKTYKTKKEVLDSCYPSSIIPSCRQKSESWSAKCRKIKEGEENVRCWLDRTDDVMACYKEAEEAGNKCVGANAFEAYWDSQPNGTALTGVRTLGY